MTQQQDKHAEFVKEIMGWLDEKKCYWQLQLIVRGLGAPRVMELLQETLAIQEQGGLYIKDGSRKRTLGGVFFYLVKKYHAKSLPPAALWSTLPQKKKTTPPVVNPTEKPKKRAEGSTPKGTNKPLAPQRKQRRAS